MVKVLNDLKAKQTLKASQFWKEEEIEKLFQFLQKEKDYLIKNFK